MKRFQMRMAQVAIIALASTMVTACGDDSSGGGDNGLADSEAKSAVLIMEGSTSDSTGFFASGVRGLEDIKAIGWETSVNEEVEMPDSQRLMTTSAQQGVDLILAHGGAYQASAIQVAGQYPGRRTPGVLRKTLFKMSRP